MADIILRSGKGSNLTPNEVDSNFKNLNDALMTLQVSAGAGTVTSVGVNNLLGGVLAIDITGLATVNPVVRFQVTGSAGYVKSSGTALSTVSTIDFTDTTGTVPINRGGTNLTSIGSDNTFLSVEGSSLIYRSLTSPDSSINLSFGSTTLDVSVNQAVLDITAMSGTLPVSMGGTGQTTRQAAIDYLTNSGAASTNQVLTRNSGGNAVWTTPGAGTGTVTNVSTYTTGISSVLAVSVTNPTTTPAISISLASSGTGYIKSDGTSLSIASAVLASELSGNVSIANGGTGQGTRQSAINALTDASLSTRGKALITNNSNNVVWSSSMSIGDISISSQRVLTSNTTLAATDYFVGMDSRTCNSIYLPPTDEIEAGKIILIKDTTGQCTSNSCTVYAYASGEPPAALENTLVGTVVFDKNYMSVEFILLQQGSSKNWYIKSFYRPT